MSAHSTSSISHENDDLDLALLERYWLKETSTDETVIVQEWLAGHPEWHERYEQLRQELKTSTWTDLSIVDIDRFVTGTVNASCLLGATRITGHDASDAVQSIPNTGSEEGTIAGPPAQRSIVFRWVGYALTLCVFSVVSIVAGWSWRAHYADAEIAQHKFTYTTPNGQRANITLPDGSEVILNAGSRLEVPANFALGTRTVQLSGEALFTVVQHAGRPFTVRAGPSVTRVLGTLFAVRHYNTDTIATVAVQDGKVSVQSTVLTAHQEILVLPDGTTPVQQATAERFSFARGRLILNGKLFRDAILDLNRWYDVEIYLADSTIGARRLTWESFGGSISDLTSILELALPVRVTREGRRITVHPR